MDMMTDDVLTWHKLINPCVPVLLQLADNFNGSTGLPMPR